MVVACFCFIVSLHCEFSSVPLYNTFNELVRASYVICIVFSMLKLQVQVYLHISLVLLQ